MKQNPELEATQETSQLLAELDQALDHSSTLRDIVGRREQLYELERLIGPSRHTRALRKEIWLLEQQLRADRIDAGITSPNSLSPA